MVALGVEMIGRALGIGERRRIAEDQIVLAAFGVQPGHRIGLDQAVLAPGHAVQGEILRSPLQVGRRQIDAGRRRRTADRRLDAGHAGVAKEIEESLAPRVPGDPPADRPVIQEQAGVEVSNRLTRKRAAPSRTTKNSPPSPIPPVLAAALAARPGLDRDLLARQREYLVQRGQQFAETTTESASGMVAGASYSCTCRNCRFCAAVFLVDIHRGRILRQVGIVDAITTDAGALAPGLEC